MRSGSRAGQLVIFQCCVGVCQVKIVVLATKLSNTNTSHCFSRAAFVLFFCLFFFHEIVRQKNAHSPLQDNVYIYFFFLLLRLSGKFGVEFGVRLENM